jgi:biotin carboxylase
MRVKAKKSGIPVPAFSPLFNDEDINHFLQTVPAPWIIKPRSEASATGLRKVHNAEEAWKVLHEIGEERHLFLIEQFKPGDVYHADALTVDGKVIFCRVSQYLNTPFEVAHGGGIFRSHTVEFGGDDDKALQKLNKEVMKAFGMKFSASHTEFIKANEDGQFYFLETSSRVGGAHLAEMVEVSSDINLWAEWAKIEDAMAKEEAYKLPKKKKDYAGILVSLSRFQHPDMSGFNDPEIVWRIDKDYHVGFIVKSDSRERVLALLDDYAERVFRDFHASAPVPDKPTD